MNEREKVGLRGLVAVCETRAPSYVMRESFHFDGRRSENTISGDYPWRCRWEYDDHGRLKQVRVSDESGEHLQETFTYSEDGSVVQTSYPRFQGGCASIDSMLHMSGDAVRITTLQDSRGNAVQKVLYDADGRRILRVLFLYDTDGRLLEEGEALDNDIIRDDFRNCFLYDKENRLIQIERYTPFGGTRQTIRYNELGDVAERRNMNLPSDLGLVVQTPWTERFTYTYDERTNWIKRELSYFLNETGETTHREEQHRHIEYWN